MDIVDEFDVMQLLFLYQSAQNMPLERLVSFYVQYSYAIRIHIFLPFAEEELKLDPQE